MRLHLDQVEYKQKPSKSEIGKINNRIIRNEVDISIQDLANEIIKGKTFTASLINKIYNGELRRSINCWSSQEIICLDFDNEVYDKITKKKYKKITMTIEQALEEFKYTAAFIYKTFNYMDEHPKFRVVFVLDHVIYDYNVFSKLIKSLLKKYPMADESCSDGSRMFFGGTEIIEINYNNKLNIYDYIDDNLCKSEISRAGVFPTHNTLILNNIKGRKNPPMSENGKENKEISDIIDDIVETDKRIVEFTHINDAYNYLYKKNMKEYLFDNNYLSKNLDSSFNCLFHEDSEPSATIFKDDKTGNYMYKCHSKNCGFTGNIVRVVERLSNMKRVETFKHLCSYYNIQIIETEWQKQQKEILDHNIYFLTSDTFKDEHPDLYKRIKRYIPMLILLNILAKQYIGTNTLKEIEKNIFTASKRYISEMANELSDMIANTYNDLEYKKINTDLKEIGKRIDLFAFLGVLQKLHISEIPSELKKIAVIEREKKMRGGKKEVNFQNFYSIPEYGDCLMTSANQKAIEFKENNMSMIGFGREMLIRNAGKDDADKTYPMMKKLELSNKSNEISEYIKKKFMSKIEEHGWVTENEILEELIKENLEKTDGTIKGKNRNAKNIKKSLNELIEGYDLKRERLNKKLIKKLQIEDGLISGYPFVIYK